MIRFTILGLPKNLAPKRGVYLLCLMSLCIYTIRIKHKKLGEPAAVEKITNLCISFITLWFSAHLEKQFTIAP